ncbi:hypothetical protein RJT34_18510 [Clitoria ternatea]|uniref:Uncharacterized protein n=1 Tax=Clitoria ternatea TaxID=43366 RepID=A0AAN9JE41_CLITE
MRAHRVKGVLHVRPLPPKLRRAIPFVTSHFISYLPQEKGISFLDNLAQFMFYFAGHMIAATGGAESGWF